MNTHDIQIVDLNCLTDAAQAVVGTCDWQWAGRASYEGFVAYLYGNYGCVDAADYDSELVAYLRSVDESPRGYISGYTEQDGA